MQSFYGSKTGAEQPAAESRSSTEQPAADSRSSTEQPAADSRSSVAQPAAPSTPRSLQPPPYTWLQEEWIPPKPTRNVPWPSPAPDLRPNVEMHRTVAARTVPVYASGAQEEEEDALHGTATPPCLWTRGTSEDPTGTTHRSEVDISLVDPYVAM